MPLDKDAVIQAVVKQHGILLSKDDPILAFLAVHDVILGEYSKEMTTAVEQLQEHLELVTDRHYGQSKELAETIVGKAVTQIRHEGKEIQEGLRSMLDAERQKHHASISTMANKAEESSKRAHLAMWAALGFSVLSVIAAAFIVAV